MVRKFTTFYILNHNHLVKHVYIISVSLSISTVSGVLMVQNIRLDHLSVSWSVRKVYCGGTFD